MWFKYTQLCTKGFVCHLIRRFTLLWLNVLHRWVWRDEKCRNLEGGVTVTALLLPDKFVLYAHRKKHSIATAPYLQYIKKCIWNQVAAFSARDKGPFLETCSEVHTNFHRLHCILEKALSINTGSFIPKTSAHSLTSQGIWSLGVAEFCYVSFFIYT